MNRIKIGVAAAIATLAFATTPAQADTKKVLKSAAIGAAIGAGTGAIVPGVSVGEGAVVGGAGGAVVGVLDKDRRYYRDAQGRKYWIDKNGRRRYR